MLFRSAMKLAIIEARDNMSENDLNRALDKFLSREKLRVASKENE